MQTKGEPTSTEQQRVEEIAKGLTKAQASYLRRAEDFFVRWATFPPPNTHAVLMRLGLVDRDGTLSDTGLRVRTHLQGQAS